MDTPLAFQETVFDIVDHMGQPWLQARQVGSALGYSRPDAILNLYERNKDEFNEGMTRTIDLMVSGQQTSVRIFSLRGCHLVAMFARTKVAKSFRKWVLDVLDRLNSEQRANSAALPEPGYLSTPADRRALKALVEYRSARTGMHIEECWADVHQRFGISRVSDLPRHQVRTAEAFVWALLDAPVLIGAHADELARLTRERELGLRRLRDAVPEYIWEEKPAMQGLLDDARELLKIFTYREGLLDRPDWGATPRSWADCPMDAHIDTDVLAAATLYRDIIAETLGSMGVDENRTDLALESFLLGAIPRLISPGRPGEGWSAE